MGMLSDETFKVCRKLVTHSHHAIPPEGYLVQIGFFFCAKNDHPVDNQ